MKRTITYLLLIATMSVASVAQNPVDELSAAADFIDAAIAYAMDLMAVEVTATTGVERVMRTPYNVVAIDIEGLAASTKNLSDAWQNCRA